MKVKCIKWFMVIAVSFTAGTLAPVGLMQSTSSPQHPATTQYLHVDYMKVDPAKAQEYLNIERELWKPMFQRTFHAGKLKQWSIYEVKNVPEGDRGYNYVAMRAYNSLEDLKNALTREDFEKTHPGMNPTTLMSRTNAARSIIRSDRLVLVEQIR